MIRLFKPLVFIQISLHVLFWALVAIFPIISNPLPNSSNLLFFTPFRFIIIIIILATLFYLNVYFLIPEILNRRKNFWLYVGMLLVVLLGFNFLLSSIIPAILIPTFKLGNAPPSPPPINGNFNIFPLALITIASFAYRYLADWFKFLNQKKDITNANLQTELAFLRSQISPHFIFNVINGIVSLSRTKPTLVEPTLIQLSKLMRYILYISDVENVTLQEKEDYLSSYIDLQRIRLPNQVNINYSTEISNPQKYLAPMLLIPFVENAFKFCNTDAQIPFITIILKAEKNVLTFLVENNYNPESIDFYETGGIGLKNVKRRLELLYPNEHVLTIKQTEDTYSVFLQIQLK